jgi:hypothetical protein
MHCYKPIYKFSSSKRDDSIKFNGFQQQKDIYVDPIVLYEIILTIPPYYQKLITGQSIPLTEFFYVDCIPIVPCFLRISSKFDRTNDYAHYITNKYIEIIQYLKDYIRHTDISKTTNTLRSTPPEDDTPSPYSHTSNTTVRFTTVRIQVKMNEIINGKELTDPNNDSCSGYLKTKTNLCRESINGARTPKTARVVLNANPFHHINNSVVCIQFIEDINQTIPYNQYTKQCILEAISSNNVFGYYSNSKGRFCNIKSLSGVKYGDSFAVSFKLGDGILMHGRQPALHQTNIYVSYTSLKEKPVINSQTTQLPTAVLPGMNGDQDGDEVWTKEVQGLISKYEQRYLMLPTVNLISPAHGGINYGIIQDELLAINALIRRTDVSRHHAVLLLGEYTTYLDIKYPNQLYFTGKELISITIPSYIHKQGIIHHGIIQNSRLKTADVGVGGGSVYSITKMLMDYSPRIAVNFLECTLKISKTFISLFPHGMRIKDVFTDLSTWEGINLIKDNMYRQIEYNYNNYLQDITDNKIIPMDSDQDTKFIKLEVAKVVTEITKQGKKIIDSYIEDYQQGKDFNRLILYILAEFKLDLATLCIIYCQANPSIEPRSNYMNRLFPCFRSNDPSIENRGLVRTPLIKGLNFLEMVLQAGKARENVVTTVCQTASKGEIGRYIIKNLENYVINYGYRFVVQNKYIMSPCLNVYKMSLKQMYMVSIDIKNIQRWKRELESNEDNERSNERSLSRCVVEYYTNILPFIYDDLNNKHETSIAYLTDPQLLFNTSYLQDDEKIILSDDDIILQVEEFFDRIHEEYLFMFGTLTTLKMVTLYYCKLYSPITQYMLSALFTRIEYKYKLYPEVGAPIGMEAGTSISEVETQSTLSAHLQFTKNGCDVKSTQGSTNVSLMKINIQKLNTSNAKIVHMKSYYYNDLLQIKRSLEYVSLEDIALSIKYRNTKLSNVIIVDVSISRTIMARHNINMCSIDTMFSNFFDTCRYVKYTYIRLVNITESIIDYKLTVEIEDAIYIPVLKLTLKQGVSKGTFSLYRYVLEEISIINHKTLEQENIWSVVCEIPNINVLGNFDTSRIEINPGIEVTNSMFGSIHAYNRLAKSYISSGLMAFHTNLLAQNQVRQGVIKRVYKNHKDEMSTVSKIAFIIPIKDQQEAVINKVKDSTDDLTSSILLGAVPKIGTGIVDVYLDSRLYQKENPDKCFKEIIM